MHRILILVVVALAVTLLAPAASFAQEPPPPRCDLRPCWGPVGSVAVLERFEAELQITDGVLNARYSLHLANPHDGLAEGRIVVPVPRGSSVLDLVLSGGPETLEGKVLDAEEAERIYEDIVRRLIDPALLQSLGDDLFEVRAFPVPAGEERTVSFTVTTPVTASDGQAIIEIPWSRMSPRPQSATVTADVDVSWEVRSALSPGRQLDLERDGDGQLALSWESTDEQSLAADFRLYLTGGEGLLSTRLLAHRVAGDDGYFALLFAPTIEVDERVDRDVVFVIDVSGSMDGQKLSQAKRAAAYVLERLGADDRFAVVAFSRSVRVFGDGLHSSDDAGDAIEFVDNLDAGGGTNIDGALRQALGLVDSQRPSTVLFLTDGLPTVGLEDIGGILQSANSVAPERTQLFAFGVGSDVDTVLLDGLAEAFVGSSHYVAEGEAIDSEVSRLFERISTPILTDIEITMSGGSTYDLAPSVINGLFAGSQALLTGRYEEAGALVVKVSGNTAAGEEQFVYELTLPETDMSDPTIAQLWAQRRVADLLTELRLEGYRESLVEEIVGIATRFGIVTPYTSYLAEEPELAFAPRAAMDSVSDEAAAPSSGDDAVAGAGALEKLRAGDFSLGGESVQVLGAQSYVFIDGAWVQSGFDLETDAREVTVGSEEFARLLASDPSLAAAASVGTRVIVEGADGWLTIVWPEADVTDVQIVTPILPEVSETGPDEPVANNGSNVSGESGTETAGSTTLLGRVLLVVGAAILAASGLAVVVALGFFFRGRLPMGRA